MSIAAMLTPLYYVKGIYALFNMHDGRSIFFSNNNNNNLNYYSDLKK